jgi:hypothetical protein
MKRFDCPFCTGSPSEVRPAASPAQRSRLQAARGGFVPASSLGRKSLGALVGLWLLHHAMRSHQDRATSGPTSGAAPTHPSARRFFGHCRSRRRRCNHSAATPGSTCARRQALLASSDLRIGRSGHGHANRRSPRCIPLASGHRGDRRYRVLYFDRPASKNVWRVQLG